MAKVKITLPNIDAETLSDKEMLRKILSYLYQLNEELRYQLTHIDDENIASEGLTESALSANVYKRITQDGLTTKFEAIAGRIKLSVTRQELEDGLSTKLDSDDPSVGVSNASVTIDPDGIYLSTTENGQITARIGDEIELQIDKDGITALKGVFDSIEAPNVVQAFEGGEAPWKGTLQATIDALPRFLKANTNITIPEGTYNESLTIQGFMGANLNLVNASNKKVTIIGQIKVTNCSNWVRIQSAGLDGKFEVYPASGNGTYTSTIFAQNVGLLSIWGIMISGYRSYTSASQRTYYGIYISGCKFAVQRCTIEHVNACILLSDGSAGTIDECTGGGSSNYNINGVSAVLGSHAVLMGSTTFKSNSGNYVSGATLLTSGTLTETEGGISYVAPTSFTQTFYPTSHCVYLLGWSRRPHTQASSLTQGSYRGEGGNTRFYAGLIWFDDAASALSGKTIVSATLTLRRSNGGYSNAVPVWLSSSALTSANYSTTLSPTLTTPVNAGTLDKQTAGTFDVTSLMSAIQAGGAIAVYESSSTTVTDTWSPAYTHFYGKGSNYEPVLTVTYQ